MSNFVSKALGLAAMATVFAGASFAQLTITPGSISGPGPFNLRAEGNTELLSNYAFTLTGATSADTVTVNVSAPVTSPGTINCTGAGTGVAGTLGSDGKTLTFSAVPVTGACIVSGVRVNAASVGSGPVTEQASTVLAGGSSTGITAATTVGNIFPSLSAPTTGNFTIATNAASASTITPISSGSGNPVATGSLPNFYVSLAQQVAGSFKSCSGENADGKAAFGTRVAITFSNVPAGATVWVPTTIATHDSTSGGDFDLQLVKDATTADTGCATNTGLPTVASPGTGTVPGALNGGAAVTTFTATANFSETFGTNASGTPASGSVVFIYEFTSATPTIKADAIQIPVWVTVAANTLPTTPSTLTVSEGYVPVVTTIAGSPIPNFSASALASANGVSFSPTQTTLIFPFVTNENGFETGIAISNTSLDPFKTVGATGVCTWNAFGANQPKTNTNIAQPGNPLAPGAETAFTLSSLVGGSFSGYLIAQCNFTDAYGFAYIALNFGTASGTAMGYIAPQLQRQGSQATSFSILGQ